MPFSRRACVVQGEISLRVLPGHKVRILARIKGTLRAGEKFLHVATDLSRVLEVLRIAPTCIGDGINPKVLGLKLQELLVVRMLPVAICRVLVDAAPDWIEEVALRAKVSRAMRSQPAFAS